MEKNLAKIYNYKITINVKEPSYPKWSNNKLAIVTKMFQIAVQMLCCFSEITNVLF